MDEPRRPRFFKVLLGDFARRIEIPQCFLCHIPEEIRRTSCTKVAASPKVVLKNAEGKTWPVELQEIDGRLFLTSGWTEFVKGNCLGEGEFLVFKYIGNMHFGVSMFGVNAIEKAVCPSASGAQATGNLGELPCDIFPSSKTGHSVDKSTDTVASLTHSQTQVVTTRRSIQGDKHTSSDDTIGILEPHEVCCSKDELEAYLSKKEPRQDEKDKAVGEAMTKLDVDKLTVDLFCAMLCLYKWEVEEVAEVFAISRGKPQILKQSLMQKLVLQFNFVKRVLQRFFPPDDNSERRVKCNLEGPNLSNQTPQCDLTPVKRRLVDEHESCDLSKQKKRRIFMLQRVSPQTQKPRRSPRLAHLNNTCSSTNKTLKERDEVLKLSIAPINQVKNRSDKSCSLHDEPDNTLKGVPDETTGFSSQDLRKLDTPCKIAEEHGYVQGEIRKGLDQCNDGKDSEEQMKRNAVEGSESFLSAACIESSPPNSGLTAYSRKNELSFTWKSSRHANPLEKKLLEIERENFMNTIAHIQKIIRDDPSDVFTANVIEAVAQIGVLRWDSSLQDRNAQNIVNAFLKYAKMVKEKHNFNIEMRKQEFSVKLHDLLKCQLKEVEITHTSLESEYKKAATYASICFSTWEEQKKKLNAIKDRVKDLQQALKIEDEMQKLTHQVTEHEAIYQKSILERVRVKMALISYQETLDDIKERLASTEPVSIDIDALVKVEMDNMIKEIELSKGSLLSITFEKE